MRRRVGAEEELGAAGNGRGDQRLAVRFALQHRQAVPVRPHTALEDGVAVVEQVVNGDGGGHIGWRRCHELGGIPGRDVFHDHLQLRETLGQRRQHGVDEHLLAVEKVDRRIGHFAVHQQRQADALHLGQRGVGLGDVGQAGVGIGRRPGRVELHGLDEAGGGRPGDFSRRRVVGQVQRHQRLEGQAGGQRGQDTVAVGGSLLDGGDRRLQVGHDDGAGELAGGVRQNGGQRLAIAQVQVPVVGAGNGQLHTRDILQ